ncbi:hypothetical protein, partial [Streptomyces sp. NPDC056154]|uniref:hypothetical protein n=1 Tax=Streptomyces sp. NPDC056154 TaxID=3345729 RepID=UPI0035D8C6AF
LDRWDDEHGEKGILVAAKYCDVLGEDNEYFQPGLYEEENGFSADLHYYRTGTELRGIGFNMEMDYLDIPNNDATLENMNKEYRKNGLTGFEIGAQVINMCHWEQMFLPNAYDPEFWSYAPSLGKEASLPRSDYRSAKAYYYSYWGGVMNWETEVRGEFARRTQNGSAQFPMDLLALPQYVDEHSEQLNVVDFWNKYSGGIWVPDSRVLSYVERDMLKRALLDDVHLILTLPDAIGYWDEYGKTTTSLCAELQAICNANLVSSSSMEFGEQSGRWRYICGRDDKEHVMKFNRDSKRWESLDRDCWIGADRQAATEAASSIREWTADATGTVRLQLAFALEDPADAPIRRFTLLKNGERLWTWSDYSEMTYDETLDVDTSDRIRFILEGCHTTVYCSAQIKYVM